MFDHQNKATYPNGRKKQPLVPIVSPSLMVADQTQLLAESLQVLSNEGGAVDWLHVDVIDGRFAPNLSFCPKTVEDLRRHLPHTFLDCHVMSTDPAMWIEPFAKAGASTFVFHIEATNDAVGLCRRIHELGMVAGVVVCAETPVELMYPVLDSGEADMALVMTVQIGFAGGKFRPEGVEKVRKLRKRYPHLVIQVDGSITLETLEACAEAGANAIVPGRAVFKAKDRRESVHKLRAIIQRNLDNPAKSSL